MIRTATVRCAEGSEQSDDQGGTGAVGDRDEGRTGTHLIEAANGYLDGDYTAESLEALQAAIDCCTGRGRQ